MNDYLIGKDVTVTSCDGVVIGLWHDFKNQICEKYHKKITTKLVGISNGCVLLVTDNTDLIGFNKKNIRGFDNIPDEYKSFQIVLIESINNFAEIKNKEYGVNCKKCDEYNEYTEKDLANSFVCYRCRI